LYPILALAYIAVIYGSKIHALRIVSISPKENSVPMLPPLPPSEKGILFQKKVTEKVSPKVVSTAVPQKLIASGDKPYLPLGEIAKLLQLKILIPMKNGQMTMGKGSAVIQFTQGQNFITYQKSKIFLAHKLIIRDRALCINYEDYLQVLVPLLAIKLIEGQTPALKTIAIDPGHGGKDPGAVNPRLHIFEKNINLEIAQRLKTALTQCGFLVLETRSTDVFVSLEDRPAKVNKADLFISIHSNASTDPLAHGLEIFTLKRAQAYRANAFDPWNLIAAYSILSTLSQNTCLENRGVKMAEFAVLKYLSIPGILIELGFVSNDDEAKKLMDPLFQEKIVQGLVEGIKKYNANLGKR
jgi:N-acetylmuramoyl-L-alanine amidase